MVEYLDGPTNDGTAGIGAEFESPFFYFENYKCNLDDTNAAKKKVLAGRRGPNWVLTADTGDGPGKVKGEYILNGEAIKVGSGDAARAGKAIADDFVSGQATNTGVSSLLTSGQLNWAPWKAPVRATVGIEDNKCNPWTIGSPGKRDSGLNTLWMPQITAPMPLEAVYSLMKLQFQTEDPPVLAKDYMYGKNYLILVMPKYFEGNPNGIDPSKVTDDVLAFCSLVLSYAKAASDPLKPDESPKLRTTFMPRTDFNTLFKQVKSKIPGDLFSLFNFLACSKANGTREVMFDEKYCSKQGSKIISNNKFGDLAYTNVARHPHATMSVKSWIQGIGALSPSPDLLSKFDKSIDGSIGGLGSRMERMYGSQRSVPLFEFRNLGETATVGIEGFMAEIDSTIQDLHRKYENAPGGRNARRAVASACALNAPTTKTISTAKPEVTCNTFSDPDNNAPSGCKCSGMDGTYSFLTPSGTQTGFNICGYTTKPTATVGASHGPFYTTRPDGVVVSCATSTYHNYAVNSKPTCAGTTKAVSTVASIASSYSSSQRAALSATACNSLAPAASQWAAADCEGAWTSAINNYNSHKTSTSKPQENFIWSIANYFGLPGDMDCADLASDNLLSELFSTIKNGVFEAKAVVTELVGMSSSHFAGSFQAVASGAVEENILGQNVGGMMKSAFGSLTTIDEYLFNGSSISTLHSIITGGQLLEPNWVPPSLNSLMNGPILNAFLASLIPLAWQKSPSPVIPVIINSGHMCGEKSSSDLSEWLEPAVAAKTGVCYQNQMWYGVGCQKSPICPHNLCGIGRFTILPGTSSLGSKAWPITFDQIVQASVNGYMQNRKKNGGGFAKAADTAALSAIYDQNITAPGVNTIPVCGLDELLHNLDAYFNRHVQSKNFPCN
ncbi:uncharacterized protein ACLA_043250 [Aspergillus clavatus NRRL 1]|uniref:Uncharacterized protein n=1 Tax=Aspergillus clavatus (strain ATCC 1007 / CBS 513.65 / DSM 816 / NCTC 3887 / NRRL 1 / QM 1276 / 107) TaxID=344612 RepID=A1C8H0_ASPCL|nr:uncharacterized protein ACLA_043250 [Aspergillus clavatus NRRL 1]EAW13607.1 hypothetical protein ACLA_043250 [Aspergillus clavatus NRRL 1]